MNKFFFPTTLIAVMAIAMVFAFVPAQEAQTLHLPTIGNAQLSAGAIPITVQTTIGTAATNADATIEPLGTITLPTFIGNHDIIISVTVTADAAATAALYFISMPASGVGTDCGGGDNAIENHTMWNEADAYTQNSPSFHTEFFCTGLTSGAAFIVGHDSSTQIVTASDLVITAIAVPT